MKVSDALVLSQRRLPAPRGHTKFSLLKPSSRAARRSERRIKAKDLVMRKSEVSFGSMFTFWFSKFLPSPALTRSIAYLPADAMAFAQAGARTTKKWKINI